MRAIGLILLSVGLFLANSHGADLLEGKLNWGQTNDLGIGGSTNVESSPTVPVPPPDLWEGRVNRDLEMGTAAQPTGGFSETRRPWREFVSRIDPFGPAEAPQPSRGTGDDNPRAWTTQAGWHPGVSAFPDPVTHESQLTILSFSDDQVRIAR